NENALGFSLHFDSSRASFSAANLGIAAAGATMYVNTNQAASGQLGLVLAVNPGDSFSSGTSTVIQVVFRAEASASGNFAPVFADSPVIREVCDPTAVALPMSYSDSSSNSVPPLLTAYLSNRILHLSWPVSASHFELQETTGEFPLLPGWTNSIS